MPTYSAERQKPVTNVWSINFTRMFVLILERQELALCPLRPCEHQEVTLHIEGEQKLTPWLWFWLMVLNSDVFTF